MLLRMVIMVMLCTNLSHAMHNFTDIYNMDMDDVSNEVIASLIHIIEHSKVNFSDDINDLIDKLSSVDEVSLDDKKIIYMKLINKLQKYHPFRDYISELYASKKLRNNMLKGFSMCLTLATVTLMYFLSGCPSELYYPIAITAMGYHITFYNRGSFKAVLGASLALMSVNYAMYQVNINGLKGEGCSSY